MPFVLLIIGIALVAVGVQNTQSTFFALLKGDVKGYLPWIASIGAIGALGYVKAIKPISDAFLVLVIIVLFLSNGGFFDKLFGTATSTAQQAATNTASAGIGNIVGATLGNMGSLTAMTPMISSLTGATQ